MIYVHVPFCRSFCTYCDFYSELCARSTAQQVQKRVMDDYVDALLTEIAERFPNLHPHTLYFGGGTPSVLTLEAIGRIVEALGQREYEEFTIEVNPDDITEKGVDYVRGLAGLGVNRISMGVQSFDDSILRWMNRRHDARGAVQAAGIIREAGVENLSIDLIFGLSQLTEEGWRQTIDEALKLKPEHISAYQLSIEEGSALGKLVREGKYSEASEEQCRRQYDILCEELARAGFVHYEISNWALPGREAKHNSAYWRRVPYIGLGPGAHSLGYAGSTQEERGAVSTANLRTWNSETLAQRLPDGSLKRWSQDGETLSAGEVSEETVMLALRTAAGLNEAALRQIAGPAAVDALLAEGSLVRCAGPAVEDSCGGADGAGGRLRIPESRFFVSDDIIARVLA